MAIEKLTAGDPDTQSADLIANNVERLRELFPEAFTEGRVDFDVLRQVLGDDIEEVDERYGLNWRGKRAARRLALTPSTGTLRPAPEESVEWDTTQNLMIEGDNLEVLKLLRKSYAGRVKLMYIDPPYNVGTERIYPDDYSDSISNYMMLTDQIDSDGRTLTSSTETSGRFHTDWLNMVFPRLMLARDLLRADGVIFVSIDEHEYFNLRAVFVAIFGEDNILGTIVWKNATDNNPTRVATEHEYLLVVAKSANAVEAEWKSTVSDVKDLLVTKGTELTRQFSGDELRAEYDAWYRENRRDLWPLDRYRYIDEGGIYTGSQSVHNPGREGYRYNVLHPRTGKPCRQPLLGYRFPKERMDELLESGRILFGEDENKIVELKVYASEYEDRLSSVLELDGRLGAYDLREDFPTEGKVFSNPKPVRLLTTFLPFVLRHDGDVAMDFFAGSGVTGKAIYTLNSRDGVRRQFCLVQLPEPLDPKRREHSAAVALCDALGRPRQLAEVTKERLRRAAAKIRSDQPASVGDLGFRVFKLDSSNIREWDPQPELLEATLDAAVENLKTDRTEQDILYELLLKRGIELTVPIQTRDISGKTVHSVGAGTLFACLAEHIERTDAEPGALGIVAWRDELAPAGDVRVVFRDSAFIDDVAKTNLAEILRQRGLADVKSI